MTINNYASIQGLSGTVVLTMDDELEIQDLSSQFIKTKLWLKERPEYLAYQVAKKQLGELVAKFPQNTQHFMLASEENGAARTQALGIVIKVLKSLSGNRFFSPRRLSQGATMENKKRMQ